MRIDADLTPERHARLKSLALARAGGDRLLVALAMTWALGSTVSLIALMKVFTPSPSRPWALFLLAHQAGMWGSFAVLLRLRRAALGRSLAEVLLEDHVRPRSCAACDYELRGIDAGACPECGQALAMPEMLATDPLLSRGPSRRWGVHKRPRRKPPRRAQARPAPSPSARQRARRHRRATARRGRPHR